MPTATCPAPRPDPSPDTPADIHFVTSRLADCGPPITFGRLRASEVGFGYRAGPSQVLIDREIWLDRLRRTLTADGRVLVYIHGYNTSFAAAAGRAASIGELFGGPVIAFSWPSQAKISRYTWDEENALWTQPHFDNLIATLLAEPRVHEIVLVAHSMGNRVALRTLMEMERLHPAETALKIRNVILAAPDIDRAIFERDYRDMLVRGNRRATVYVSRVDRPLRASWAVHGYGRVGDSGCHFVDVRRGRERRRCFVAPPAPPPPPLRFSIVETSLVRGSQLGHSDFVESEIVRVDLCRVLHDRDRFPEREAAGAPNVYFLTRPVREPPCVG